ncbi:MAG: ATP-binding cassette domain-containing protein [Spirochaetales bacterium]|nr:ATP-binding cassette domain-containing protein [Spirochaetales bacterium]
MNESSEHIIQIEEEYLPGYPGRGSGPRVSWEWRRGESWVILGDNGSGKTHFSELIEANTDLSVEKVSFEELEALLEEQIRQDDSEYSGKVDTGIPLYRFLDLPSPHKLPEEAPPLPMGLDKIMESGLRVLSTGETRKALIYKAMLRHPGILILDEPFDGLDRASVVQLQEMLNTMIRDGWPLLMILNRKSEILEQHSHVAVFREFSLIYRGERNEWESFEADDAARHEKNTMPIPSAPPDAPRCESKTLVEIKQTSVRYGNKTILDRISWEVKKGEHWKITGPNGAGKSTLLNLITGDQPQAYANDVRLFGVQKGSGESIWDIKKKLGIISPALQLSYRVSLTARMCVISGLYDSIGVYNNVPPREKALADSWLCKIGLNKKGDTPYGRLSYGEQRLLLIARGLIKHPPLLILDEPCQGLDDRNREQVLELLGHFARESESTLLYVTHHEEDRIDHINRHLRFCPDLHSSSGFTLTADGVPLRG